MTAYRAKTITANSVSLVVDGKTITITKGSHPKYEQIRDALKTNDYESAMQLYELQITWVTTPGQLVTLKDGKVFYKDVELHNGTATKIIQMAMEGFDVQAMQNFLGNLMENSSFRSIEQIGMFQEQCNLPISDDGYLLAWKRVTNDMTDFYTGTFDNSVGKIVEMPRNMVDDDPTKTCSNGLHFCSESYLPHYHSGEGKVILIKIHPRDIVSIPIDYEFAKGRCCRYEVLAVLADTSNPSDFFNESLVTTEQAVKKVVEPVGGSNARFTISHVSNDIQTILFTTNHYMEVIDQFKITHNGPYSGGQLYLWDKQIEIARKDCSDMIIDPLDEDEDDTDVDEISTGDGKSMALNNSTGWPFATTVKNQTLSSGAVTILQAAAIMNLTKSEVEDLITKGALLTQRKHGRTYVVIPDDMI